MGAFLRGLGGFSSNGNGLLHFARLSVGSAFRSIPQSVSKKRQYSSDHGAVEMAESLSLDLFGFRILFRRRPEPQGDFEILSQGAVSQ